MNLVVTDGITFYPIVMLGGSRDYFWYQSAVDPGRFVGFRRTPLRPGMVVENDRTAWLYKNGP